MAAKRRLVAYVTERQFDALVMESQDWDITESELLRRILDNWLEERLIIAEERDGTRWHDGSRREFLYGTSTSGQDQE